MKNTFNDLKLKKYKGFLFYFNDEIYDHLEKQLGPETLPKSLSNKVILLDNDGKQEVISERTNLLPIYSKQQTLDEILFELGSLSKEMPENLFITALRKYEAYLKFDLEWSIWMLSSLNVEQPINHNKLEKAFEVQFKAFQKHHFDVTDSFKLKPTHNLPKMSFPKALLKRLKINKDNPVYKIPNSKDDNRKSKEKATPKRNKNSLISDEEARQYLLKSVFDIGI
ncbi:hypothetical protein Q2T40_09385 [Winogradskyella maritima]|uniref:Uncharacterized protein n=1 Tax=Winogradskyella maritima TaxID=1517766 RepID=A0ABV8AGK2_9FLAO|nr:hypothetical protein [Winogradskyella maritima]